MTSLSKDVFSIYSASFLPSLFLSVFMFVSLLGFVHLFMFKDTFCSCYLVLHVVYIPVCLKWCMCVYWCACVFMCLQVFEALTPGGSHHIKACPLHVGYLPSVHQQQTDKERCRFKFTESLCSGKKSVL